MKILAFALTLLSAASAYAVTEGWELAHTDSTGAYYVIPSCIDPDCEPGSPRVGVFGEELQDIEGSEDDEDDA